MNEQQRKDVEADHILLINLNYREVECFMCGEWCEHKQSVPTVNGDIVSNDFPDHIWGQHGGGQAVCERCFERHAAGEVETLDRYYLYLGGGMIHGDGI